MQDPLQREWHTNDTITRSEIRRRINRDDELKIELPENNTDDAFLWDIVVILCYNNFTVYLRDIAINKCGLYIRSSFP
jgi:hypothetical protein